MSACLSVAGYVCLFMAVVSYALYSVFAWKANAFTETEITFIMLIAGALFLKEEFRQCAVKNGVTPCGDCHKFDKCKTVGMIISRMMNGVYVPWNCINM